jgi:hypothetical protein
MFLALWEFEVKSGYQARFCEAYGPQGPWVRLFRTDSNFIETRLLQDPAHPERFVTLDFWLTRAAYESFRELNHQTYAAIDKTCEELTTRESLLGEFETL